MAAHVSATKTQSRAIEIKGILIPTRVNSGATARCMGDTVKSSTGT